MMPWLRRGSQLFFFLLFLVLLRQTTTDGTAPVSRWLSFFFLADPLAGLSAMISSRSGLLQFWPALLVLLGTLWLGRWFCGWFCPLGALLDAAQRLFQGLGHRPTFSPLPATLQKLRWVFLAFILVGAALGFQTVGWWDPFSLLTRAATVVLDPALGQSAEKLFGTLYHHAPSAVTQVSEPLYTFLQTYILPFDPRFKTGTVLAGGLLLGVILLEWIRPRFWCRALCPLGALLGCAARASRITRFAPESCGTCTACARRCPMGAFRPDGSVAVEDCTLCMDCTRGCAKSRASFQLTGETISPPPLDVTRRAVLGSLVAGVVAPLAPCLGPTSPRVLRPPGASDEGRFLDLCIRCAECLKVCPTGALHPTLLEAGLAGLMSPQLIPRLGYCEYECQACSEICPTGAIPHLPLEEKQLTRIGVAQFDHARCLPWAKQEPCLVCEEHCPVPHKAIVLEDTVITDPTTGLTRTIGLPRVRRHDCIGCGICENKCPLEGAAIHVIPRKPRGTNES
jgi:polyferredoxin